MKNKWFLGAASLLLILSSSVTAQSPAAQYKISQRISILGDGFWDYLSVDEPTNRLFVSHANKVDVVDLKTNKPIAIIPNTPGVHGITFANDLNKGFISDGRDSSVTVFNLSTSPRSR